MLNWNNLAKLHPKNLSQNSMKFELTEKDMSKVRRFVEELDKKNPTRQSCVLGKSITYWFIPNTIGMEYGVNYKDETLDLTDTDSW